MSGVGGTCLVLVLAGCSIAGSDPQLMTSSLDVVRAESAWSDPWAAPDTPTLTGVDAITSNPVRAAGSRTTEHPPGRDATASALAEVRAAEAAGWALLGARCGVDAVEVALARGTTVDDGVRATLTAEPGPTTTVRVGLEVAHHDDGAWPVTEPVGVEQTCLAGDDPATDAEPDTLPADPPSDAYDPGGGEPGPDEAVEWERSERTAAESALRAAVVEDPWFVDLDAAPEDEPEVTPGANPRSGEVFRATVTTDADDPAAALVRALAGAAAWEVTWVTCGAGSPAAASARLVTPDGAATARLTSSDGRTVEVEVRLPVPEAPPFTTVTDPPELDGGSPCLGGREPSGATTAGTPVAVPGPLLPYLG